MLPFLFTVNAHAAIGYLDHFNIQHAGEIGYVAAGLGKQVTNSYSFGIMYGLVPREIAETESIETLAVRQTLRLAAFDRLQFYAGLTAYHVLGIRYQSSKYGEAPRSYYPLNSLRALVFLGGSVYNDFHRKNAFYFESGLNDVWLMNYFTNKETINPFDHVSLAMGWRHDF